MHGSPNIARIGTLLGDNARASMLSALMHGKALTASELAFEAGITPQTATSHLAKLEAGGLLVRHKQGRHRYFALASADIAALLETLMGLSVCTTPLKTSTGPGDAAMRHARVCYNHLAGNKGVALYESLLSNGWLIDTSGALSVSPKGFGFLVDFGIDLDSLQASRSPLCKSCLDWSERRIHLAGSLGRALLGRFEKLRWVKRDDNSRIVRFTPNGEHAFGNTFRL